MASIPAPPPPPPPPKPLAGNFKLSPPPPPPPSRPTLRRTTDTSAPLTSSRQAPLPQGPRQSTSSDDLASLDALIDTEVNDTHSELVTSSVSTTSPSADIDEYEFPSTPAQPASPRRRPTVVTPHPPRSSDDELPKEPLVPYSVILQKSEGVLSTSSVASSPRRPRRVGTAIPGKTRTSDFDFEVSEDIGPSARDEFEEEFLNRNAGDRESQMISDVLERVNFRQLSDDEEVLSDDAADALRRETAVYHLNESPKQTKPKRREADMQAVHLDRIRQTTVQSKSRRVPSEVGCEGCEGCYRLCRENRKLRRQLDELEFELASGVVHNSPDGFDSDDLVRAMSSVPQLPTVSRRKKGWTSKLLNATASSVSSSKPGERARLKAEVQALSVTTEYLWRKLNKAESELRNYRRKDLRSRMKLSAVEQQGIDHDREEPRARHLDLVGSNDWDWE